MVERRKKRKENVIQIWFDQEEHIIEKKREIEKEEYRVKNVTILILWRAWSALLAPHRAHAKTSNQQKTNFSLYNDDDIHTVI